MKVNVSKEITSKQQNYIVLTSLLGLIHLILDIKPELKLCGKKNILILKKRLPQQNQTLDEFGNDSGF